MTDKQLTKLFNASKTTIDKQSANLNIFDTEERVLGGYKRLSNNTDWVIGANQIIYPDGSFTYLIVVYGLSNSTNTLYPTSGNTSELAYAGGLSDKVFEPWFKTKQGENFRGFGNRRYYRLTDAEVQTILTAHPFNRKGVII